MKVKLAAKKQKTEAQQVEVPLFREGDSPGGPIVIDDGSLYISMANKFFINPPPASTAFAIAQFAQVDKDCVIVQVFNQRKKIFNLPQLLLLKGDYRLKVTLEPKLPGQGINFPPGPHLTVTRTDAKWSFSKPNAQPRPSISKVNGVVTLTYPESDIGQPFRIAAVKVIQGGAPDHNFIITGTNRKTRILLFNRVSNRELS